MPVLWGLTPPKAALGKEWLCLLEDTFSLGTGEERMRPHLVLTTPQTSPSVLTSWTDFSSSFRSRPSDTVPLSWGIMLALHSVAFLQGLSPPCLAQGGSLSLSSSHFPGLSPRPPLTSDLKFGFWPKVSP